MAPGCRGQSPQRATTSSTTVRTKKKLFVVYAIVVVMTVLMVQTVLDIRRDCISRNKAYIENDVYRGPLKNDAYQKTLVTYSLLYVFFSDGFQNLGNSSLAT